ncbi:prepilin peptidase [Chloroflexota bacterium]
MAIIFGLFGISVGSFLNVCIDRLPAGGSLLHPASHCSTCQHHLASKDLIPVFSYLWLRGRCRYCRAPIPQRVLWVELVTGLMFAFLWWQYGPTLELGILSFYYCLLAVILVIDLEQGLILNKIVYPATAIALIVAVFAPDLGILKALMGGGLGLVALLIVVLIFPRGMGWGDVKMAGLMGVMVGFPGIVVALLLAIVSGGLVAAILLALKVKGRKATMPFGPFLSLATMVTLLWGYDLMSWYLGFFPG